MNFLKSIAALAIRLTRNASITVRPDDRWLVVCAANRGRSVYAAAVLRYWFKRFGFPVIVESAGYHEVAAKGVSVHPDVAKIPGAARFDFSKHVTTAVQALDLTKYKKILCIDAKVVEEVRKLGATEGQIILLGAPEGISDPVDEEKHGQLDAWPRCGRAIEVAVEKIARDISIVRPPFEPSIL